MAALLGQACKGLPVKNLKGVGLKPTVYLCCDGILQVNFPKTALIGTVFFMEQTLFLVLKEIMTQIIL